MPSFEQLALWQEWIVWGLLGLAALTFLGTLWQTNAYGRHMAPGQKFTLPSKPAWLIFECPQWWAFAVTFWLLAGEVTPMAVLLFGLWQSHYLYRSLIYPLRKNDRGKRFPVSGVVFGFAFNAANGFANGWAVAHAPHLSADWISDPWFIGGFLLAVTGWWINFSSDSALIRLRADGSSGYKIPHGGLFRWISSPNYFGEILLWGGWAMMSWTLAGLVFALFTISNLLPRALSHHRWYQQEFSDYPAGRKAIIPGLL